MPRTVFQTTPQRHANMAAIHSKDTKPELIVRRYLWSHGFRYRLNHKRLPGKPDVVLRKYHTCIFINGCFWHGHTGCSLYTVPKTNTSFWTSKVKRNKERDRRVQQQLASMGWHCITVWECQLTPKEREATLASLAFTLNTIFLKDLKPRTGEETIRLAKTVTTYDTAESNGYSQAAEDTDIIYNNSTTD